MKLLLIPILFLLLLIPVSAFAQTEPIPENDIDYTPPETGVFRNHNTSFDNESGEYSMTNHPTYFEDYPDNFVPYRLIENDDIVQIEFATETEENIYTDSKYVFNKNTGTLSVYDENEIQVLNESYVVRIAELNTDTWTNLDVNNTPVITTIEEINGIVIVTFTKENFEGLYDVEYIMNGNNLKTTAKFTNNNPIFDNHKFAFTQTVNIQDPIITLNDQIIDLNNYLGQSFPREVLELNEDLILGVKDFYYNSGIGFENLWSVNIDPVIPTKISLDYANVNQTKTDIGETVELDPSYTKNQWAGGANSYQAYRCSNGNIDTNYGTEHYIWMGGSGTCVMQTYSTSLSSIPSNASISSATFGFTPVIQNIAVCTSNSPSCSSNNTTKFSVFETIGIGFSNTGWGSQLAGDITMVDGTSSALSTSYNSVGISRIQTAVTNGTNFVFVPWYHHSSSSFAPMQPNANWYNSSIRTYNWTTIIQYTIPSAPSTPSAPSSSNSNGNVYVTWSAPSANPAIDYYHLYRNGVYKAQVSGTSYTDTSTSIGTGYYYSVKAHNSYGFSGLSGNSNTTYPSTTPSTPSTPSVSTSNGTNSISWSAPSSNGASITSYQLYRNNGSFITTSSTSYSDSSGSLGTGYYYKVRAFNSNGWSGFSGNSSTVTPSQIPSVPSTPSVVNNNGVITISYSAPSSNGATITNYNIQRSDGYNVGNSSSTSITDSTGTLGTSYTYKVRAYNLNGWSGYSLNSSGVIPAQAPSTPTSLTTAQTVANQISLSWSAPSSNGSAITNYKIYLAGVLIDTIGNVTTYTDSITGSEIGSSLVYTVKATNGIGDSSASSSSTITAWDVPSQVVGVAGVTGMPIVLTWNNAVSDDTITNYKIYRDGSLLTTVGNVLTYSDNSVVGGNTYSFEISGVSAVGEGIKSVAINVVSGISYNPPTNVSVTIPSPNSAPLQPVLTWTASTSGSATGTLTGYEIFRDTVSIGTVGLVTTYTDTVSASGTYAYVIQSTSSHGNSANSLGDTITTPTAPSQVTLSLTPISTSQIDLSWSASSANGSNLTGYQIERSTDGTTYQTTVANTNTLNTAISTTSLSYDTQYWYKVSGINNVAVGTASVAVNTWTMIDSPTSFLASGVSTSQIDLSWTAPLTGNILGYHIEKESTIGSGVWQDQVANTGNTNVVNSITGLASGVSLNLRVSAINSGGSSVPSNESSTSSWGILSAPVLDTLTQVTTTSVKLDWTAPTGLPSVTGYNIERQLGSGWVAIQTPTATNAITYTDSTLASGDSPTYRIYAINSIGTSLVSNELSINPPSSGGGGGSGSQQSNVSVTEFDDVLNMNFLDDIHRVILGQQLSDSVKVVWDSSDNLEVTSIIIADSPVIIQFQSTPFMLIGDPSGLSEGIINYSVQIPNVFCNTEQTINCITQRDYEIPVEITAKYGSNSITTNTMIKLDLKEETDIPLVFVLGAIALPVGVLLIKGVSKHGTHQHRHKAKLSSGSSRKNGSGKSSLTL